MEVNGFFEQLAAEVPGFAEAGAEVDPPHFLAANVLALRTARGMTQAALAKVIGVAQPRIAEIERGEANPRLSTIGRIARALDVTVADLLSAPAGHPATRGTHSAASAGDGAAEPRRRTG